MADSNLARSILELYPEITIDDSRSTDKVVTFSLMEKTFALLCPEEQTPTSVAVILIIDDDFDYPHIMLSEIDFKGDDVLAKGKYRFVCLHQSGSVVSFLQSFEEKITDEIERLIELMHLSPKETEREYQKEFLYYWKEKKEEKVLQMIEETEGFIPSGRSFLDGKSITEEDIKWIKKIPQKRKYKGILFDIGSGVLQSIYLLQTFDVVIVPYLKDTNALAKKHCFETLLEQYEMLEHLRGFLFVDMGDSGAINKVKERLLEGDRL